MALYELTDRENEIAELVARGLQNKEVAEELGIARATVVSHLRKVFIKMRVRNRTELARLVMESQREAAHWR